MMMMTFADAIKGRHLVCFKALSRVYLLGELELPVIQAVGSSSRDQESITKDADIECVIFQVIW